MGAFIEELKTLSRAGRLLGVTNRQGTWVFFVGFMYKHSDVVFCHRV